MSINSERLSYSAEDAAALLGISERYLRGLARTGEINVARIHGRILFPRSALVEFLAKNTDGSGKRVRPIPPHIRAKMLKART